MVATGIILHVVGGVLGAWSATLLWRLVLARIERRRLRTRPRVMPAIAFTRAQRRRGLLAVCLCLPGSIACIVLGERLLDDGSAPYGFADATVVASGALAIFLAAGAACAGWFFDPSRGRQRCPSCWYELVGIDPASCPECGRRDITQRQLFRTRRSRHLLTLASLLLVLAASIFFVRLAQIGRAAAFVPTGVMIAALPWLPQPMLSGDEASLGDRIRDGDLSDLQRARLRRRCRQILESSLDPDQMTRIAWFYISYAADDQPPPRMQHAAAATLMRSLLALESGATPIGPDARRAEQHWQILARFVPDELTPETAASLLPDFRAALASGSPGAIERAFELAPRLGKAALPLLPLARTHVRTPTPFLDPASDAAIGLIAALAPYSEEAWKLLLQIAPDGLRSLAAGGGVAGGARFEVGVPQILARMEIMEPKLIAVLDADSDEVVAWAGRVLLTPGPWRERNLDRLTQIMKSRLGVATGMLEAYRRAVRADDRLVDVLIIMIESQDPLAQDAAAGMCLSLTPAPASIDRLLPALRKLRTTRSANNGSRSLLTMAIDHLQRLAETNAP